MKNITADLITAIVTPFTETGAVDVAALSRLTQHLIDTGSNGILVSGSTGENPTLSHEEKRLTIETVKQAIGDQPVQLIVSTGTNNTAETIEYSREVAAMGVDALLVVVPYYNKPSQKGLLAHFSAVAEAVPETAISIYNIPGRVVITMTPETVAELASRHPNIIGIKQSVPDLDQASEIIRLAPKNFKLWCGDDSLTLPMMSIGAVGIISVASHVVGSLIRKMLDAIYQNDYAKARELHLQLMPIFKGLFTLPNPVLVKACASCLGLLTPAVRLPLVIADVEEQHLIIDLMAYINNVLKI